jgi:hypothetical protein
MIQNGMSPFVPSVNMQLPAKLYNDMHRVTKYPTVNVNPALTLCKQSQYLTLWLSYPIPRMEFLLSLG